MPMVWRHQFYIVLVGVVVLFTNLGGTGLWDRDEPRNAGCAREMLQRGDWIVPTFNDELRAHKPALLYWLIMSAYQVLGVSELAARFWSAALGVGTLLLTYHIGRLLYRAEVGLWGALILATSLMFGVSNRAATPDASLLFCCTLVLLLFALNVVRSNDEEISQPSWPGGHLKLSTPWLVAMYAAMGLGVLAKGPVAVVLPVAALVGYLLLMQPAAASAMHDSLGSRLAAICQRFRPRRLLAAARSLQPLTAAAVVGVIALPWYILVALRTEGAFLHEFLGQHNVARFTNSMENHRGPLVYYIGAILVGMAPGSVFAVPVLVALVRRMRSAQRWLAADRLLVCWAAVIVGFFSLAATKLPSYVLPAYPALALLTGAFVHTWLTEPGALSRHWFRASMAALAIVGVGLGVGLPLVARRVVPGEELLGLVGIVPLAAAVVCLVLHERGRRQAALGAFAVSAVVLSTAVFGLTLPRVDRHQNARDLMALIDRTSGGAVHRIASYNHFHSTYPFYARQRVEELSRPEEVERFFQSSAATYLLVPEEDLPDLQPALPADAVVLERRAKFLKPGSLVLVGREGGDPQTALRAKEGLKNR